MVFWFIQLKYVFIKMYENQRRIDKSRLILYLSQNLGHNQQVYLMSLGRGQNERKKELRERG